jgi:sulfite reductase beta subunit-like hemoprotein
MSQKIEKQQLHLRYRIAAYMTGDISIGDLKHDTAPLGIYPQRDDLFMARIRINGGSLTAEKLSKIANVMDETDAPVAHLTTRQDIQLHNIEAGHICNVITRCADIGLPFRGGGGNTIRNILVSESSGVNPDECFDVQPYADALWEYMFNYEKAYELPRKLKIGFAAGEYDDLMAQVQDLGYVATHDAKGAPGFRVYGGGGMGRESSAGVKLFDFIPQDQVTRCAVAMTDLFHAHGDRVNRNRARIRFILKKIGESEFVKLFEKYYAQAERIAPLCQPESKIPGITKAYSGKTAVIPGFSLWEQSAVTPTSLGEHIVSVRFFVPRGNLTSLQMHQLATLTECGSAPYFRLTRSQDLLMPQVQKSMLPEIYRILRQDFKDIDLTGDSFRGHIVSCVGSALCKIGILDSPVIADATAEALDELFKDNPESRAKLFPWIVDSLRISGCQNACAAHPAAMIGVQGSKKKLSEQLEEVGLVFTRSVNEPLGKSEEDFLPVANIPGKIRKMVKHFTSVME